MMRPFKIATTTLGVPIFNHMDNPKPSVSVVPERKGLRNIEEIEFNLKDLPADGEGVQRTLTFVGGLGVIGVICVLAIEAGRFFLHHGFA